MLVCMKQSGMTKVFTISSRLQRIHPLIRSTMLGRRRFYEADHPSYEFLPWEQQFSTAIGHIYIVFSNMTPICAELHGDLVRDCAIMATAGLSITWWKSALDLAMGFGTLVRFSTCSRWSCSILREHGSSTTLLSCRMNTPITWYQHTEQLYAWSMPRVQRYDGNSDVGVTDVMLPLMEQATSYC